MQRAIAYAVLAAAAIATVALIVKLGVPTWGFGVGLGAWLLAPHVLIALALGFLARTPKAVATWSTMAILVPLGGLGFLVYVIFIAPDPQGGIAIMFTPIYQLLAIGALFPLCEWLFAS